MKKNNYMKIINTCHAFLIGVLILLPFIFTLYYLINNKSGFVDYNFFYISDLIIRVGGDSSPFYSLFLDFFTIFSGGEELDICALFAYLCTYYMYVFAFEFLLGLFRKLFNYIMEFIMGGDIY